MGRTKSDTLTRASERPIILEALVGGARVAANQVVIYFDKQEDALLFTLAASSIMSEHGPPHSSHATLKVAEGVCKASRIPRCSERLRKEGTNNMIRKVALQLGACVLLTFIAWNAFLTVKHLRQLQTDAALTLESSMV